MHVLGKVFAWLLVLAAVGAVLLTGKFLQVRNSWAGKVHQLETQYATVGPDVEKKQNELNQLRSELSRTMLPWDRYWPNINTGVNDPAQGTLVAQVGTARQLRQDQVIHAFRPAADGLIYVGHFRAVDLQENQAVLEPNFRARPEDIQTWQPGAWHFWSLVPPAEQALFTDLEVRLALADELLAQREKDVEHQTQLAEAAQRQLELRRNELLGGPLLSEDENLPPEQRVGLVQAIEDEQQARDELLADVDRLRRTLRETFDRFQQLQEENEALVNRLPRADQDQPANVSLRE